MVSALALNVGVALAVAMLGFSLLLFAVSVLSYARLRSLKLLVVGGAFLVLAAKGALWTYRGFALRETDLASVGLDFAVLAFLYASVAQR